MVKVNAIHFKCKKFAFTLAEVLLVLAITGIVASLTIPQLLYNTQKIQLSSTFKKKYSEINQVWNLIINDNNGGIAGSSDLATMSNVIQAFSRYMNISGIRNISLNPGGFAFPYTVYSLSGVNLYVNDPTFYLHSAGVNGYNFSINDGTLFYITNHDSSANCDKFKNNGTADSFAKAFKVGEGGCYKIYFDITGSKPPNTLGRDIFPLYLTNKGLNYLSYEANMNTYSTGISRCNLTNNGPNNAGNDGDLCPLRIMKEGDIEY